MSREWTIYGFLRLTIFAVIRSFIHWNLFLKYTYLSSLSRAWDILIQFYISFVFATNYTSTSKNTGNKGRCIPHMLCQSRRSSVEGVQIFGRHGCKTLFSSKDVILLCPLPLWDLPPALLDIQLSGTECF